MRELHNKVKSVLVEDYNYIRTQVPWDGMFDSTIEKIITLVKQEKPDIDYDVSAEHNRGDKNG